MVESIIVEKAIKQMGGVELANKIEDIVSSNRLDKYSKLILNEVSKRCREYDNLLKLIAQEAMRKGGDGE